jgi:hypothetical protein
MIGTVAVDIAEDYDAVFGPVVGWYGEVVGGEKAGGFQWSFFLFGLGRTNENCCDPQYRHWCQWDSARLPHRRHRLTVFIGMPKM